MQLTIIIIGIDPIGTVTERLVKDLRRRRTSGDYPNYSIVENGQNTEKNPGDFRRHAVTNTLVKEKSAKTDVKTLK